MDEYIEQQAGMAVSEIFRQYGEDDFRRREREACRALARQTGLVIAAGGGALTFAANVEALRPSCVIVLLEVKPETVLTRLKGVPPGRCSPGRIRKPPCGSCSPPACRCTGRRRSIL